MITIALIYRAIEMKRENKLSMKTFLQQIRDIFWYDSGEHIDMNNKEILEKANSFVTAGDNETFLTYCTDDTKWTFVGDRVLEGKEAVRQYMAKAYQEPPQFMVENLVAEGDFVTAIGKISMKDESGRMVHYSYCDVWKFRDGKMAELKAFVIEDK